MAYPPVCGARELHAAEVEEPSGVFDHVRFEPFPPQRRRQSDGSHAYSVAQALGSSYADEITFLHNLVRLPGRRDIDGRRHFSGSDDR